VISAAVGANEPLDVDVVVVDEEVCGDGAGSGTEEIPTTDTGFGCELVGVDIDDEKVRLERGMEEMTTEVEVLWTEEDEDVVMAEVDEELELDTDAGGSPGVAVHCRTTCTRGWPFGPLIGVNVTVHVSVTGPALV